MSKHPQLLAPKPAPATEQKAAHGNVDYVHPALAALIPQYEYIRDCIDGDAAVKKRGDRYLPMPNAHDKSVENVARYDAYIQRAIFYNVTKRTLSGFVGQVYLQDPVIDVPPLLDPVVKDANGSGVTLVQLSKLAETSVLAYGRSGILADYPFTDAPTSRADQMKGDIRPTLSVYEPWNIINWRTIMKGGKLKLSLVVLKEQYEKDDDGFEETTETQYRVLRLVNGVYQVEIWRGTNGQGYAPVPEMSVSPTDAKGRPIDEIPFMFIGVENNDVIPDAPPLYDMAVLNIGHYRNSADYEESVYMLGQPTPYFSGLTESWVTDVLKGTIHLGSRAAVALPEGGSAGLLQVEPNTLAQGAMDMKERQMVAIGARLVEQKSVQRTAMEAGLEAASETSTLAAATKNVSAAFQWALEWAGIFSGAITEREDAKDSENRKIRFELNTEFDMVKMSPEQIKAIIEAWLREAITTSEMRKRMRHTGAAFLTDDAFKAELKKDREDNPQMGHNGGPTFDDDEDEDETSDNTPPNDDE